LEKRKGGYPQECKHVPPVEAPEKELQGEEKLRIPISEPISLLDGNRDGGALIGRKGGHKGREGWNLGRRTLMLQPVSDINPKKLLDWRSK